MTAVRGYPSAVSLCTAHLFLFPLGLETTTAAILLYKSQILRFLNPRLLFMYWRGSVKGVAVSKSSAAAISKVSKPNVDCTFRKKSSTVLPFDAYLPDRFFPFLLKPSFSSLKIGLAIWSSMTNSVGESSQWEWALMGSLQVVAKGLGSETLGY